MKIMRINWPGDWDKIKNLRAGDFVLFSGIVYSARDQAHKRLVSAIKSKKPLPINLKSNILYYVGPTPAPKGKVIGACGPTTSSRMDAFVLPLMKRGLIGMIGKGSRGQQVRDAIKKYKGIYFITIGGAGAFLSQRVKSAKPIAYKDLGPEAIYQIQLHDFPLFVGIDSKGRSI